MATDTDQTAQGFDPSATGALAHLYRGEMYRSTMWRTRLDTTTNWAVVTTGLALSLAYSAPDASPLPLCLVGLLVALFLYLEARRYRYFDSWRLRVRVLENFFYSPILQGQRPEPGAAWARTLGDELERPSLHLTMLQAMGRRIRRNYAWIFSIQLAAYIGKLIIHPTTLSSVEEFWARAAIGPVPGQLVLLSGAVFHSAWIAIALLTWRSRRGRVGSWTGEGEDPMLELAAKG